MMDALFELTALPNLHTALVRFSIALSAVALLFDAAVFIRGRWASADWSAAALWALAAAGAGAAYAARRVAADGVGTLSPDADTPLSRSELKIGLSAVGRHWKGFVDGRTVVNGHAQLPGSGRATLLLDGTGMIRLISLRISPVSTAEAPAKADEESAHDH
jgi:hypothetical protein